MKKHLHEYQNYITELFPEVFSNTSEPPFWASLKVQTITFQVTEACNLNCSYCYQTDKHNTYMSFDIAKVFIDNLIDNRLNKDAYINEDKVKALIIEFIGGEPFLNIDLIAKITNYFEQKLIAIPDSPWSLYHIYSISSNGTLYFNKDVQKYIKKYHDLLSVSITIDGCKQLHDTCRKFKDGSPSYDLAIKAALAELNKGQTGTKITLAPDNINFAFNGVKNMLELGFNDIHMNPVYESGWTLDNAKDLYAQYKLIADYIRANNLYDKIYISALDPELFKPLTEDRKLRHWCGSSGNMIAIDYKGDIYPCIRFMESSLGKKIEPFKIGTVKNGIGITDTELSRINLMRSCTTCSMSKQKCIDCPIGNGCSWCNAYNYQCGNFNTRTTFICNCHKAAALGALYLCKINNDVSEFNKIKISKDLALDIITVDEWNELHDWT